MIFILLGAPGVGKGTQAELMLKQIPDSVKISTGDLLREHVRDQTELGLRVQAVMAQGCLVSDDILNEIIVKEAKKYNEDRLLIFDGYPRTLVQAKALNLMIVDGGIGHELKNVIHIHVPMDDLLLRLVGRLTCSGCGSIYHKETFPPQQNGVCDKCHAIIAVRPDDEEDKVKTRLEVYFKDTYPLVEYYKNMNVYTCIDGKKTVKEVFNSLIKMISV
jgi:adenylate kinase